jgi:hypothetical protein
MAYRPVSPFNIMREVPPFFIPYRNNSSPHFEYVTKICIVINTVKSKIAQIQGLCVKLAANYVCFQAQDNAGDSDAKERF